MEFNTPPSRWCHEAAAKDGAAYEAEVRRRGYPFQLAEEGVVYQQPGAIPVAVLYGNQETLQYIYKEFEVPQRFRRVAPMMHIRSMVTGGGWASFGGSGERDEVDRVLAEALRIAGEARS